MASTPRCRARAVFLDKPVRLSNPIETPLGSRVSKVEVVVDFEFTIEGNRIQFWNLDLASNEVASTQGEAFALPREAKIQGLETALVESLKTRDSSVLAICCRIWRDQRDAGIPYLVPSKIDVVSGGGMFSRSATVAAPIATDAGSETPPPGPVAKTCGCLMLGSILICCGGIPLSDWINRPARAPQTTAKAPVTKSATASASNSEDAPSREDEAFARLVDADFEVLQSNYQEAMSRYEDATSRKAEYEAELNQVRSEIAEIEANPLKELDEPEERTWRTLDRKHSMVGTLLNSNEELVRLEKADGAKIDVPIAKLIADDRVYISARRDAVQEHEKVIAKRSASLSSLRSRESELVAMKDLAEATAPVKPNRSEVEKIVRDRIVEKDRWAAVLNDWPRSVVDKNSIGNIKYSVTYRLEMVEGRLPDANVLRKISDDVERANPGFERYFVSFLTPSQRNNEGSFAMAHRNPKCVVQYQAFLMINDFYIPEAEFRAACVAAGKSPDEFMKARRELEQSDDR